MSDERDVCPNALKLLKKYFVFDEIFNLLRYDQQFDVLHKELSKYVKESYPPNYRFIFLHHDTEYFLNHNQPGFTLINLQRLLQSLDISNGFCLIISQQDLTGQLELVRQQESVDADAIGTIQTTLFSYAQMESGGINQINIDNIHKVYTALNGIPRYHRRVLVSLLQDKNLLDQGFVSYNS